MSHAAVCYNAFVASHSCTEEYKWTVNNE